MQGGVDAQLSRRRSMQLHANPSNGRRLHSLPLLLSSSLSMRPSSFPPPFLRPPLSLSPLLPPQPRTYLVTPPFSLHPRSMTSARGNASQRRLLSLFLFLFHSICPAHSFSHLVAPSRSLSRAHSATTPLAPSAMQFVYIGAGLLIAIDSPRLARAHRAFG